MIIAEIYTSNQAHNYLDYQEKQVRIKQYLHKPDQELLIAWKEMRHRKTENNSNYQLQMTACLILNLVSDFRLKAFASSPNHGDHQIYEAKLLLSNRSDKIQPIMPTLRPVLDIDIGLLSLVRPLSLSFSFLFFLG